MDLMAGIAAIGQAIGIAKDLRDIERGVDAGSYKAQIGDLYMNLGEAKIALTDALDALRDRDTTIAALRAQIDALKSGEACPICQTGNMKITASRADPIFGPFGHQERTVTCQNPECGHQEKRKFVPPEGR